MTTVHRSGTSRHLVLRLSAGETVPRAIAKALRDEQVACGWLRGSGVLADVDLRAYDADIGGLGSPRRIAGPVQALILEGSIGLSGGETTLSLRALLARQADFGLQTLSGEIEGARSVALEVFVTALDDIAIERGLDETAGVWVLGAASGIAPGRDRQPAAPLPIRPIRPGPEVDAPFPEPGDAVEHFAFGHCEVIKSDGDRLHLRLHKDSRIREIALAMLRVSRLPDADDGRRRYKLERRI
jgi:predicted DNA-binding protein with PD1-like motif